MARMEKFFALSTCVHCKNTVAFFKEHNVDIHPVYVDQLEGEERDRVIEDFKRYNPDLSFPTLVFDDGDVIIGFQKEAISEKLGLN